MIKLEVGGNYCQNCPDFEADIEKNSIDIVMPRKCKDGRDD